MIHSQSNNDTAARCVMRTGLLLAVALTLAACSQPPEPVTEPGDPYANGASHPWTQANASAPTAPQKRTALADLKYRNATNAWGPIESGKSNGSFAAGDGRDMRITGVPFMTGLGVHADSELTYALDGTCTTFTAKVGVDDEVGARGSVVFEVRGNGQTLGQRFTKRGGEAASTIEVSLKGITELKLVVTDAGDGIAYDHADWADAYIECSPVTVTPPPPSNTFTFQGIKAQPVGVSEAQGEMVGGKLYVFGGFDSLKSCCTPTNRAQVFDPATNTWTPLKAMPGTGVTHTGMATDGTNIYYAGGYVGKVAADGTWSGQIFGTTDAWIYTPASNTYSRLPNLPTPLSAGQLEYLNGKLHYFGATNPERTEDLGDHYVLDRAAGAKVWTRAATMPHPRQHMGSAVIGGKIYAIGGQTGHDEMLKTQSFVDVYDPATNTWTAAAPLVPARSHIANSTFVLNGRIVVAGGEPRHNATMANVDAYDPTTNTWSALTPLPQARASSVAGPLGYGFLYTGGNASAQGWKATATP
ncbi:NPCBM/NEW2 domain-containing protein [Deinococcus yunweiensis]|uniref:NPCBM/NEW2 domain-containing protein n=1 Tax=Deinococcus yunweiensis TaxID=367282 RepID=UPI00398F2765